MSKPGTIRRCRKGLVGSIFKLRRTLPIEVNLRRFRALAYRIERSREMVRWRLRLRVHKQARKGPQGGPAT